MASSATLCSHWRKKCSFHGGKYSAPDAFGRNIGDGAAINAFSVVTSDVEPYAIVAGNPAQMIRKRFDQETIDKLLEIKWWNWSFERIKENMPLLLSDRTSEFIERNQTH